MGLRKVANHFVLCTHTNTLWEERGITDKKTFSQCKGSESRDRIEIFLQKWILLGRHMKFDWLFNF